MAGTTGNSWERKEELVLQSLENLRLSSDAALKAVGEVQSKLAVMEVNQQNQAAQIKDLRERLDKANAWLMGILATLITTGAGWVFFTLVKVAPH